MAISDATIADRLGEQAFAGIVDKAGKPYWGHCLRVAERVRAQHLSDAAIAAAMLHDIVEDGLATFEDLASAGLSPRCIELVCALTRPNAGEAYLDYVRTIADSGDRERILIKLADNADNTDPERVAALPQRASHQSERYAQARTLLESALSALD